MRTGLKRRRITWVLLYCLMTQTSRRGSVCQTWVLLYYLMTQTSRRGSVCCLKGIHRQKGIRAFSRSLRKKKGRARLEYSLGLPLIGHCLLHHLNLFSLTSLCMKKNLSKKACDWGVLLHGGVVQRGSGEGNKGEDGGYNPVQHIRHGSSLVALG